MFDYSSKYKRSPGIVWVFRFRKQVITARDLFLLNSLYSSYSVLRTYDFCRSVKRCNPQSMCEASPACHIPAAKTQAQRNQSSHPPPL